MYDERRWLCLFAGVLDFVAAYVSEYDVHGVAFVVEADDERLHAAIADILRPFLLTPAAAQKTSASPAWRMALHTGAADWSGTAPGGGVWFALSRMRCFGDGETLSVSYADVQIARLRFAERYIEVWIPADLGLSVWDIGHAVVFPLLVDVWRQQGLYHVHAAALADTEGRVVLFPAESGSGKTTLTLALARAGFAYLTDDAALLKRVDGHIEVLSFPEPVNVTLETSQFFPELRHHWCGDVRNLRGKAPIECARVYGTTTLNSGPVSAILFPGIGSNEQSTIEPLDCTSSLFALLSHALPSSLAQHTAAQFALFSDLVEGVPSYRLCVGRDFEALPHVVRDILAPLPSPRAALRRTSNQATIPLAG